MKNYHDLMREVLAEGVLQPNRTGISAWTIPGAMLSFDLADGFPAMTTKKLFFRSFAGELLGFLRGYTNAAQFRELGVRFWDANANETPAWLANPNRKGTDDLGRIYGAQWTDWEAMRIVTADQVEPMMRQGWIDACMASPNGSRRLLRRSTNQVEEALRTLITDPFSRRIIINGWNPGELDLMALPPCHIAYQFLPHVGTRELHITMWQRSCDLFLGIPANISNTALLLCLMARFAGFTPRKVKLFLSDVHIYGNHVAQVHEQLSREPYELPRLQLSERLRQVTDAAQIPGIFAAIEPADIALVNYRCHDAIQAPMAA